MANKKTKKTTIGLQAVGIEIPSSAIIIEDKDDAVAALEEMEEIAAFIEQAQKRTVELKQEVTQWAVKKKVDVIQLDGHYYRQINRTTRGWDNDKVEEIVGNMTVEVKGKTKKLWHLITRRVVDPEKIDTAVKRGWISEKKIGKAFVEKPQNPFLQKFTGEGIDA